MSKYQVTLAKTIFFVTTVEADDEQAAFNEAHDKAPQLCINCVSPYGEQHTVDDGDEWVEPSELIPGQPDAVKLLS